MHWAGRQTVGIAASAYSFMRLWSQPDSKMLEGQLLERLASAPWRLITNRPPVATAPIPEVKSLLHQIIEEETFVEVRTNQADQQFVLAIRLDNQRANVWGIRLAQIVSSLEGGFPPQQPQGWNTKGSTSGRIYDVQLIGPWIVFGIANQNNTLFQETKNRLQTGATPFTITTNHHWLAVDGDAGWLAGFAGATPDASANVPRISMALTGDGASAVVSGELTFKQPLGLDLKPWAFPKGQVSGEVVGISAVRGTAALLKNTKRWQELQLGEAPDQIFTWADAHMPSQMHVAATIENPEAFIQQLGKNFAPRANPWLAEHALGSIAPLEGGGLCWKDLPMIAPYLRAAKDGDRPILEGGLVPNAKPGRAAPPEIYPRPALEEHLALLNSKPNLVAYQWETTGARAESVHVLGQLLRVVMRHPQMPAETMTSKWLQTMRPRLGNTTTFVTLTAPNTLAFERRATTGFDALELHVLADWIESPQFPHGFYSTLSPVGEALKPVGK